jgi:fructose-1-phosphate kinase PfkB-like protein
MMPQKDQDHGEGKMHRTSLMDTMKSAAMLLQIIQDEDDLPEWVESKITKATDYLSSVRRYLQGEEARIVLVNLKKQKMLKWNQKRFKH